MWVIITQLKETFNPPTGVFRTLTVITMRQVHDQTSALEPFAFTGSNELINDTLSIIDEVTELCFLDRQGVW